MNEELLIRFLTHSCTEQDNRDIMTWMKEDKANADWLFEMEKIWNLKDELRYSDKEEIERSYRAFTSKISQQPKKRKTFILSSLLKYAAIVIVVLLLGANLYTYYYHGTRNNEIYVPKGQRVFLTMTDGSKVALNSDTRFIYPAEFRGRTRNVQLIGEAFFEVAHNAKQPFIVTSKLLHVKVLGTKFDMRAYNNEKAYVGLTSGKVEVETGNGENKMILRPNEAVSYSLGDGISLEKNIDSEIIHSWTKGEMGFVNKRLDEICKDLERKYNVSINIADRQLSEVLFTCRFKESVTIDQVMTLLKETRQLDYTFDGNTITIFKLKI